MTKQDFIDLVKELGFSQTWSEKPNLFSIKTDIENNQIKRRLHR